MLQIQFLQKRRWLCKYMWQWRLCLGTHFFQLSPSIWSSVVGPNVTLHLTISTGSSLWFTSHSIFFWLSLWFIGFIKSFMTLNFSISISMPLIICTTSKTHSLHLLASHTLKNSLSKHTLHLLKMFLFCFRARVPSFGRDTSGSTARDSSVHIANSSHNASESFVFGRDMDSEHPWLHSW